MCLDIGGNVSKRKLNGYFFIAPSLIGMGIFILLPFVFAMLISFTDWFHLQSISEVDFLGIENYTRMFSNRYFLESLSNNFRYSFVSVPVSILIAVIIANFLNDKVFAKGLLRAMYFFPYITNGVAAYYVWMLLFQPRVGPINMLLSSLGVSSLPGWLTSTVWALPALIIINVWATLGYNIVVYVANMQNIPYDLYEAADIDGANGVQKFVHITFPLLTPATFFLLTTGLISSFKVFGIVSALTQGGPIRSTYVLVYYIYVVAFRFYDLGYASAMSVVLFIIIFIITLIQWKLQKRWVFY